MKSSNWMSIGAAAVLAGVVALGMAYASSGVVSAQNGPCDATSTPVIRTSSQGGADFQAAAQVGPQCTAEPTRGKLRTHTPTATSTAAPKTNTPVPPTAAPTNTPKPVSGNEGVAVKPPNTGSGDGGTGGSAGIWLLALGVAAIALGGGAFVTGVRRR